MSNVILSYLAGLISVGFTNKSFDLTIVKAKHHSMLVILDSFPITVYKNLPEITRP